MPPVTVLPVQSRRQQREFVDLPWRIYRGDEHWIPPLRSNVRELVGFSRHPFHERNEVQAFLACRGDQVVGRVAAIVNQTHIERYDDRRGFFGFFESEEDAEVAHALLDAVRTWLSDRDIHDMRGPTNPSLNYECGLLIEGFDSPPFFMMTHNPPYYGGLLEGYGFRKVQDMYAFHGHVDMLSKLDQKLLFIANEARKRLKLTTRCMDRRRFAQEVHTFLEIYNASLAGTWGFTPLTTAEMHHLSKSLRMLIVPELTSVVEAEGRVIGASFGLLDYNPRIKQIDVRLFPLGFIRLLWNKRALRRIRLISTNVIPEYQRWGVGVVLMQNLVAPALNWGIKEAEFSWVLESNSLSAGTLKRGGAKITKTYRMYDFGPTPDPQAYLYAGKLGK
jgi:GNAT superfamily N-acetyltransferase